MNPDCWNQIGVWGDRNCPELLTHSHCRNCPVYATAGRKLLEREAPAGYRDELTHSLAQQKDEQAVNTMSIGIFRLKGEWLALPAYLFIEITEPAPIHTLPHRSNNVLLGVVNIRGEIHICISLSEFLGLEATASRQTISPIIYQRMVVVEKESDRWVFLVDEMYGVQRINPDELQNVPTTVSKTTGTYTTAIINWQNTSVSYLDEELLFYTLNKKLL